MEVNSKRNKSIFCELSDGKTKTGIAKKYGITRSAVYKILKSFKQKEKRVKCH